MFLLEKVPLSLFVLNCTYPRRTVTFTSYGVVLPVYLVFQFPVFRSPLSDDVADCI